VIWNGNGMIVPQPGEPALRSCPECNPAHEYLRNVHSLHSCNTCGRYWVLGRYIDSFEEDEDFDAFFASRGMQRGGSTFDVSEEEAR